MVIGEVTMSINETVQKYLGEGKKVYKEQHGIGKAKYTVSFHDGKKKNKDGSEFYDLRIFKNKKDLADFIDKLKKDGYSEEY